MTLIFLSCLLIMFLNSLTARLNFCNECLLGRAIHHNCKVPQWFYHCDRGFLWQCLESLWGETQFQVSSWNAYTGKGRQGNFICSSLTRHILGANYVVKVLFKIKFGEICTKIYNCKTKLKNFLSIMIRSKSQKAEIGPEITHPD
jgi:hypothetical protein